jgi:hypothetical protein
MMEAVHTSETSIYFETHSTMSQKAVILFGEYFHEIEEELI